MNKKKQLIKLTALLLFVLISLSSCTTDGDTRIPIERIDLSSSEFEGGLFVGVTNRVAPQSSSAALSDSHLVLADVSPSRSYPATTAIYNETRIFDKKDVSFDFFYGIPAHYFPDRAHEESYVNRNKNIIYEYVNIRLYVESSGISMVISVNDDFYSNRNNYIIHTSMLTTNRVYSYNSINHSEKVTIPEGIFTERVGTVTVGIEFYGFINQNDDPAEAKKIVPTSGYSNFMCRKLGYVNIGDSIILFEYPYEALNRYK